MIHLVLRNWRWPSRREESVPKEHYNPRARDANLATAHLAPGTTREGIVRFQTRMQAQYLCCGASAVALLAAREAMPGSCCTLADAEVDVELGREMGSIGGGGRTCASSIMARDSGGLAGAQTRASKAICEFEWSPA